MSKDLDPSYYATIPAPVLYHKKLKPNAKLLYGVIVALTKKEGYCYASNAFLADTFNLTPSSVSKLIKQLSDLGFIAIKYQCSGKEIKERRIFIHGVLTNSQGGIDKKTRGYCQKDKDITIFNNNKDKDHIDIEFEQFWDLYDKKLAKPKCLAKWKKLKQSEKDAIYNHLPAYLASTPDKQYRKNPLTYLNGECWNDEIVIRQTGANNENSKSNNRSLTAAERVRQALDL